MKKDDVLRLLNERIMNEQGITYPILKKEDKKLLYAIERHIGSITKACEELGISEEKMISKYGFTRNINKRLLTEDEILDRLLFLKSIGMLKTSAMRTEFDDLRLEVSIKKIYGSVEKCLRYHNLERDTIVITKKKILEKITDYSSKNIDMCYSNMIVYDSKLVHNATNKFKKSWHKILSDEGIPFVPKRIPYSKKSISDRLNDLFLDYGELNYSLLKLKDPSLLYYSYKNYDRLEDFFKDMGYDENQYSCREEGSISMGFEFEIVFKEILEALNIKHKYNKYYNSNIRPDFQLEDNTWIDCKLSSWTNSIDETIKKYSPYCENIIIVFLRGQENCDKGVISIDRYYKRLKEIGREDLVFKCQGILNNK